MTTLTLAIAGLVLAVPQSSAAALPETLDLERIRGLPVQHDGRWPPLDTVARDVVESVTGELLYEGHDPLLLFLGWTFAPEVWEQEPLIRIEPAQLRTELELPDSQAVFSYAELVTHQPLRDLIDRVADIRGRKPDPLESKVGDISGKLFTLQAVFHGHVIHAIPDPDDAIEPWRLIAPRSRGPAQVPPTVRAAWASLREAFLADDAAPFDAASTQLVKTLAALPVAHRPDPRLIATELHYNRLRPFRLAWMVMVAGAVLALAALLLRMRRFDRAGTARTVADLAAVVVMLAGFGVLTYGLSLRWQIAGRIPAANMYESLLFLSWGMGAFAIISMLLVRDRFVPLTASALGAAALLIAEQVIPGEDHYVRPIGPVLMDTVWMSIHVPIIMVSYSVLALAVLIAHVQLVVMAAVPRRRELADAIDSLHYWYVHIGSILLLAGIVTGSMWAAASWGRYWGWDPKEVWSLVAFLGYLTILHVRINRESNPPWAYAAAALLGIGVFVLVVPKLAPLNAPKLLAFAGTAVAVIVFVLVRGQFATALKSILAFWLIIMTYVGVNYVLGIGLHSYGFGKGAVVRYMFLVGGIDLALIGVCCTVYVARARWELVTRPALPQTTAV
jgi:ABC-type transport system involved in cytochrome c biogenesis permease subunit